MLWKVYTMIYLLDSVRTNITVWLPDHTVILVLLSRMLNLGGKLPPHPSS